MRRLGTLLLFAALVAGQGGITDGKAKRLVDKALPMLKKADETFKAWVLGKDTAYHRCLAESLAAGGKNGIATLYRRYKTEKKRREIRLVAAESLAKCGDPLALDTLVKICFDKDPAIAAAAVGGVGAFPKTDQKKRKQIAKKLVGLYAKVTDNAAGKEADAPPMLLYRALKDPMNATLGAFTGQKLNSAAAWKAWLSENITSRWPG